ncbi:XrtA-associated tyrosine autokinase [Alteromonas sp. S167]|uniref:XrtA-associated tyrosine autokinase n=1 Tax=Alteromonas sp. S167 TaxID=3117402 RepID=UPI002FE19BB7
MNTIEKALNKKRTEPAETSNSKANEHGASAVSQNENEKELSSTSLGSPFDVAIDTDMLERSGFVSVDSTRRLINEEYRAIKRKLLQNAFGSISKTLNNANIIMVSSARPNEGKTFTAVNLALSIAAEKDKTVLLVDADVLRPNVAKTLGINFETGLIDYLLDEKLDIADVMYKTNVDKLRIIPAGKSHHLSTELLASEKMQRTIDEIATRYPDRVVIIDTPPLIGINETAILTNFAGQAVVVCEEGKARLTDINRAVSLLNPEMAIGFVVNKAIVSVDDDTGYYGYYHTKS